MNADLVFHLANAVLGVSSLTIGVLFIVAGGQRRGRTIEPVTVIVSVLFLAIGIRGCLRGVSGTITEVPDSWATSVAVLDTLAAVAALTFLAFHRRVGMFVKGVDIAREYETEFAAKEREARALAQVNEELRRLDELKSEFLAMVSHELRTPLTAIIGYSRLLMRQVHGPLSPKQLEQQEAIFRSAQRLAELINDLLDVSRLEAGRIELQVKATDVRLIVDQVIAVVSAAVQAKQLDIRNEIPVTLSPVSADPSRLQQILVNLVGNAVKFTPAGGSIRILAGNRGDQVWIAVEDTGVGMAREEIARIWDPFYQVESPLRRRHGGSGLGLSIVRRLVELHGGVVRADSEGQNRGSRFTFTLPVSRATAVEQPKPIEVAPEPVLTGRVVLIVEDEKENQVLMRAVVEDVLGGKAIVCEDGERALFEAVDQPPDLILLDLMLPRVSGWEVARRLRQSPRTQTVPIIAVSALARSQEREAALHAGCDAYLAKPFTPEEMTRVVAGALSRHGVTR